jgi:hypothetical protein
VGEVRPSAPGSDEQQESPHGAGADAEASAPNLLRQVRIPEREERFHPARPNRRGEVFAWLSSIGMAAVILIAAYRAGGLRFLPLMLFLVFFTAGVMISFGNLMDANTWVSTSPVGIQYHSPLRHVRLNWHEVQQLSARPLGRGWRITVVGDGGYFRFRTGVLLQRDSDRQFSFGFPEGERLVGLILGGAALSAIRKEEAVWQCRRPGQMHPSA